MEWLQSLTDSRFIVSWYIYGDQKGFGMKGFQFVLDGFKVSWSKPLVHVLWYGSTCLLCVVLQRWKSFVPWVSIWGCTCLDHVIRWLLSFNFKSINYLRIAVTGPILSLTTNHVCSSHSLDLGFCIQWCRFRNCFQWYFFLLSTHCLYRFLFHKQVMILVRSYNRLSSLAIASVDGCCLYIIIHNSLSWRTWWKRAPC